MRKMFWFEVAAALAVAKTALGGPVALDWTIGIDLP